MSIANTDFADVPAVLPGRENDEEREKLVMEAAGKSGGEESDILPDDDEDLDEELGTGKPSKKKLFAAFAGFVLFFVLLLAVVCWFFGIGFFSALKTQPVDRTPKANSAAPKTEDEKLRMALSMVAEKNPAANTGQKEKTIGAPSDASVTGQESSLTLPADVKAGTPGNVSSPLDSTKTGSSSTSLSSSEGNSKPAENTAGPGRTQNSTADPANTGKSQRMSENVSSGREIAPPGRSSFFGKEPKQNSPVTKPTAENHAAKLNGERVSPPQVVPFGSILPIRLIGSVYTLRNSAGFVRMELTRGVEGKGFSYPAGTVIVGTLRGSEYNRGFISIVGLIDGRTGNLIKFSGEVLGTDGASGISGRRRRISSAWSRTLAGMRDAGTAALGAFGNLHSGGTVVISDSMQKSSRVLSDQVSDLMGSKQKTDEFVELAAGTNGYVLVTNIPGEEANSKGKKVASSADSSFLAGGGPSVSGLTDEELADLFSSGSPEKLRAAIPRMTPEFRKLAEQALAALERE